VLPTQETHIDGAVDIGRDIVLVVVTTKFGGRSSGVPVEQRFWFVAFIQDAKIKRTEAYTEPADAVRALGARLKGGL
jgi:ketosteroid isomerase-like protein